MVLGMAVKVLCLMKSSLYLTARFEFPLQHTYKSREWAWVKEKLETGPVRERYRQRVWTLCACTAALSVLAVSRWCALTACWT